jgi:hypothetical protein
MGGEPGQERDRLFIRPNASRIRPRQREIDRGECAASLAEGELGSIFGSRHRDDHFLEERAQEFFAIAIGGRRRYPDLSEIRAEGVNVLPLLRAERRRLLVLSAGQFRFRGGEVAQPSLPFGFQAARDQAMFGFDQSIAALGAFGA